MKKYCYVNGRITSIEKPQIKLNDLGLLRGYAVFDFIKVEGGQPLFWTDHVKRFRRSAKTLGLQLAIADGDLLKIVKKLLAKNKVKNSGSVRLLLSGGETKDGITPGGKSVLAVLIEDSYMLPKQIFSTGGKLITVDYLRIFPEAKTTNYLLAVSLQKAKKKNDAVEILYLNNGKVYEASTSSFFMVKNKKIITPKVEVLPGITRAKIIVLAKKAGYKVEEREILLSEVWKADEVFITATNKDVAPIVKIDNKTIGNGKPGPITLDLLKRYRELVERKNSD